MIYLQQLWLIIMSFEEFLGKNVLQEYIACYKFGTQFSLFLFWLLTPDFDLAREHLNQMHI